MDLYFDESGNTGLDLLNATQKIAGLASTSLSSEHGRELVGPLLLQGQKEAKYSRLKGTVRGQDALLKMFSSDLIASSNTRAVLADKRYYVITHLVDKLIEPTLLERQIDLYEGDGQVNMVNMFYFVGPHMFPDGRWQRFLEAFVQTLRRPSQVSFRHYDDVLHEAVTHAIGGTFGPEVMGLHMTKGRGAEFLRPFKDMPATFDPMPDLFIMLVNFWMTDHEEWIDVTHDVSKPLRRHEEFLRLMMTPLTTRHIGYGKRTTELPLRVSNLRFADSTEYPQLQVADLVAGAAVDLMSAIAGYHTNSQYHEQLLNGPFNTLIAGAMIPIKEIERANDPLPGQVSLVDGSAEFIREAAEKRH